MNRPLVWVALSFVAGLATAAWLGPVAVWIAAAAAIAAGGLAWARRRRAYLRAPAVACAFLAVGLAYWPARHAGPPGDPLSRHIAAHAPESVTVEGRVRSADLYREDDATLSLILDVDRLISGSVQVPCRGRVYVVLRASRGPIHAGERLRLWGDPSLQLGRVNPGVRGFEDRLRIRGVHSKLWVGGYGVLDRDAAPWWSLPYWASRLRGRLAEGLRRTVPGPAAGFLEAVWLGDRGEIDGPTYESFVASGTAHTLAISGLHMGILYLWLRGVSGAFTRRRRIQSGLVLLGLLLMALMTGGRPSVVRAALMLSLVVAAGLLEREPDAPTALSIAALGFLLWNPRMLLDTGFQLSFLCVTSLLLFTRPLAERLPERRFLPRQFLAAPVSVQILALPLVLARFHVLPVLGPVANLLAVPLLFCVLITGMAAGVLGMLWTPLGVLPGHAAAASVAALRGVAELTARLPFARLTAPSPSPVAWLACAAAAYGLYMALTAPRRPLAKRYAVATALCVVTAIAAWSFRGPPRDEAVFLDVGHGDATFIATAHGERLLIDGGARQPDYDAGARIVGPFLRSRGVAKLDYVIATHADNDHIGGLISVVESYNVQAAILGPDSGRPLEREFITACRRRGVPVHRVRAGDRLALGGVRAEVLHPPRGWTGGSVNDASVVLRLDWPDRELPALLLPGDIELEAESTLAKRIEPAPLLKVPHHGSKTSSSPAFLSAVAPKIGVVSTGGSRGREAVDPVVMARYAEMGALVWRTDVEGGLTLRALGGKGVLRGERRRRGYPAPKRPTTAGAAVDNL